MSTIQSEFDKEHGDFKLAPGEYEGPLVIRRPCIFDGGNATIWAQTGPVLTIESTGVTVRNLRVEIAGTTLPDEKAVAVQSSAGDTVLKNVEVKGNVVGIAGEQAHWNAPSVIALGEFASNKQNSFTYEITVPTNAAIECRLKDVEISPTKLVPGKNTILIKTASMRDNTILYGEILLKTVVSRRIYLSGQSKKGAPEHHELPSVTGDLPVSEPVQIETPDEIIAPSMPENQNIALLSRGQRLSVSEMSAGAIKIVFEQAEGGQNADIDPYVFRLGKNGKVSSDNDLIFFGNPEAAAGDVKVISDNMQTIAVVNLSRASDDTDKYVVCFSIYEESGGDFSQVKTPNVRVIYSGKDVYRFPFEDLSKEKTVVAVEFYRYKGTWKLNAVGRCYQSGLPQLCESYGVNVEQ